MGVTQSTWGESDSCSRRSHLSPCLTPKYFSILPSAAKVPAVLNLSSLPMWCHALQRTSELYVLGRRASATRDQTSTESSLNSCVKEETSPVEMALVASLSMMRTSPSSMKFQAHFPWLMLVPTRTALNSLFAL